MGWWKTHEKGNDWLDWTEESSFATKDAPLHLNNNISMWKGKSPQTNSEFHVTLPPTKGRRRWWFWIHWESPAAAATAGDIQGVNCAHKFTVSCTTNDSTTSPRSGCTNSSAYVKFTGSSLKCSHSTTVLWQNTSLEMAHHIYWMNNKHCPCWWDIDVHYVDGWIGRNAGGWVGRPSVTRECSNLL